ncbi:glycine cleavage system T protein [Ascobolus immersus RN42]|uniref:Aminomethyltransferase n=1 Tax=Ascobolus immersus RN42 TaxID=1160509 RepID=A0A3N4I3G5_ASCIM|nr:glycine cleavage system T protein [Ascobolus immersus RN42]
MSLRTAASRQSRLLLNSASRQSNNGLLRGSLNAMRTKTTLTALSSSRSNNAITTSPASANAIRSFSTTPRLGQALRRTPLYNLHLEKGAKMVPYAGWSMPVLYDGQSMTEAHNFVREKAGLFDVSHMRQHVFEGPGAVEFLETITPTDVTSIPAHESKLSAFLLPMTGGIVDDCIITRLTPDLFYIVTNAGRDAEDTAYLAEQLKTLNIPQCRHHIYPNRGLLALQGPHAAAILAEAMTKLDTLQHHTSQETSESALKNLKFGQSLFLQKDRSIWGFESSIIISRGGYTGEDGFEISLPGELTEQYANTILETGTPDRVRLIGLGPRDSLRLEAGMCLYGEDLDDTKTPVDASLNFIIPKNRRQSTGYHGHQVINAQLAKSAPFKKRVGIVVEGPAPARKGTQILGPGDDVIGVVTSGIPSPTLGKNIAMGYLDSEFVDLGKNGTDVGLSVRGKRREGKIVKMPFVPHKYYKGE